MEHTRFSTACVLLFVANECLAVANNYSLMPIAPVQNDFLPVPYLAQTPWTLKESAMYAAGTMYFIGLSIGVALFFFNQFNTVNTAEVDEQIRNEMEGDSLYEQGFYTFGMN